MNHDFDALAELLGDKLKIYVEGVSLHRAALGLYGDFLIEKADKYGTLVVQLDGRDVLKTRMSRSFDCPAGDTVHIKNLDELAEVIYDMIDEGALLAPVE